MTDRYDASNPQHRKIAHEIELGDGIPEMRGYDNARQALKSVGFVIEHEEDLAERDDHVPWYYPLEGDIRKAQTLWDGAFPISRTQTTSLTRTDLNILVTH
jgi:sterol 24-C-methyltransferase